MTNCCHVNSNLLKLCVPFHHNHESFHGALCPDYYSLLSLKFGSFLSCNCQEIYIVKKQVSVINVYRWIQNCWKSFPLYIVTNTKALSYIESIATDFCLCWYFMLTQYIIYEICLFTLGYIVFLDQNIRKQIYFTFHIVNLSYFSLYGKSRSNWSAHFCSKLKLTPAPPHTISTTGPLIPLGNLFFKRSQ